MTWHLSNKSCTLVVPLSSYSKWLQHKWKNPEVVAFHSISGLTITLSVIVPSVFNSVNHSVFCGPLLDQGCPDLMCTEPNVNTGTESLS